MMTIMLRIVGDGQLIACRLTWNREFLQHFLSLSRWYFRKIKRIEAEKKLLLPENEHGAFLIRDSESRHNDYSLSGKI